MAQLLEDSMRKLYGFCLAAVKNLGTLAVVLIGITAVFGLSACAVKPVTNASGVTTTVATFSTTELNANAQAGLFALNAIAEIPKVQAALKANPADAQKFTDAVTKLQDLSNQIAKVTNGSVTLNIGKTWATDVASELQTALAIASPIVGAVYPSAQTYVNLAEKLVPVIGALVQTFGEPAPVLVSGQYGASSNMSSSVIRTRLYRGV